MQITKSKNNDLIIKKHSKNVFSKLVRGFTLIEIMVAVSIFAMVMVVAIGAVLSIVAANRKSQAVSSVLTNLNFGLEAMVRDLRTGYEYSCDGGEDCPEGGDEISFYSTQSEGIVSYGLMDSSIAKSVGGDPLSLTGHEVEITELKFYVVGADDTDRVQPRITIVVKGVYQGFGKLTEFNLQTMVSQRRLDI